MSSNSKILPILIPTLYRQVAHLIGFKSIAEIQVSLAPTKNPLQPFTIARDKSDS